MLKDLFKKKEEPVNVELCFLDLSIEDAQTISDFIYMKMAEQEKKSKKKMDFEKFYTTKLPIGVAVSNGKVQIYEDLSKVYEDEKVEKQ